MIGVVDIGNTRTKIALFAESGALEAELAIPSGPDFYAKLEGFLRHGIVLDRVVIGSVVPSLTPLWAEFLMPRTNLLHVAGHDSPWGFRITVDEPETLGVDRLANLEGALSLEGAVLVVDAGTATKFDLLEGVNPRSFPGGAIAPGFEISYEAMLARAEKLKRVDLSKFSPVLGYNTDTAIRSGVLHGFAAQVDGMVARIFEERQLRPPLQVVATGGNAPFLQGRARFVTQFRPRLTQEGLRELARKI